MAPRRALVIGRFQPPHHGHLACIKAAAETADEVVIAIGSAQRSHSQSDIFTAGERVEMLAAAVQEARLPVAHIIPVPDLDQYHLWTAQVQAYMPHFDVVVTGSPMTELLFARADIPVQRIAVTGRDVLQGTAIRRRLFMGEDVNDAVPASVAAYLERPEVRARLEALAHAAEGTRG